MGVCWQSTGDSSKSKINSLTNQVITASYHQPIINQSNQNIPKRNIEK